MKVLSIETSGRIGSVATCDDGQVVRETVFERGMEHGRALIPRLSEAVTKSGWSLADLALIAVSQGPGSYTGLRVGLTCAKTLAAFGNIPLVGVPSLDVLAQNAALDYATVCPVIDAKRGQVYSAFYEPGLSRGSNYSRQSDVLVLRPEEITERIVTPAFVFGDGLKVHRDEFLCKGVVLGDEDFWRARASQVALLGVQLYNKYGGEDPLKLAPIYLRRPEAEERWKERLQGENANR